MYNIVDYGRMLEDSIRIKAYARALKKTLKPGQVVVDIGTGTGFFALLACRFGAKKVYAIEPHHVIQVAREISRDNHIDDRITFIQDTSKKVSLPEKADVIISDLRGILPLFNHHIPAIMDARERFLSTGGKLIPQKDTLWAAVAEAPELFGKLSQPWNDKIHGLTIARAKKYTLQSWIKGRVEPSKLLSEPKQWALLDYMNIQNPDIKGDITCEVSNSGTGHGFLVWFDTILTRDIGFSNAPFQPELIYSSAYFPWLEPVNLKAGNTISLTLKANLIDNDYLWQWCTRIFDGIDQKNVKKEFSQSSFQSIPVTLEEIKKKEAKYRPRLNSWGKLDQAILNLMDGKFTIQEVTDRIYQKYPEEFTNKKEVFNRVCRLSNKYG